jgi:peptide/nickel transport system ATP-binding protein
VKSGEILGLVGESGSGKTTTALALLGYTRHGVVTRSGSIEVGGQQVIGRDARAMRSLRGRVVSYVPQDPGGALNPSLRVGDAIMDVLRPHRSEPHPTTRPLGSSGRARLGSALRPPLPAPTVGGQQQRVTMRWRASRASGRRA